MCCSLISYFDTRENQPSEFRINIFECITQVCCSSISYNVGIKVQLSEFTINIFECITQVCCSLISYNVAITGLLVWPTQSESTFHLLVLVILFYFSVSVKVLPITPLLSGVFVNRAFRAYFLRIQRVVGYAKISLVDGNGVESHVTRMAF